MNLVLLRHATRSAFGFAGALGSQELPLNTIGLAQAEDLVAASSLLPSATQLLSSPKLRARQTLAPLARHLKIEVQIIDELDERRDAEAAASFEARVRRTFDVLHARFSGGTDVVYLCSHLDWLEAAALLWPTDFSDREANAPWSTLEYQVFEENDGILKSLVRGRVEPRGEA